MHDIEFIRRNSDLFSKMIAKRGIESWVVDKILELNAKKRALTKSIQDFQMKRNEITDKIPKFRKDKVGCINEM